MSGYWYKFLIAIGITVIVGGLNIYKDTLLSATESILITTIGVGILFKGFYLLEEYIRSVKISGVTKK